MVANILLIPMSVMAGDVSFVEVKVEKSNLKLEKLHQSKDVVWGTEFLDENTLLFTEKSGKLFKLDLSGRKVVEIQADLPTEVHGQGGLMDIKKSPDFESTQRIFLTTSILEKEGYATALFSALLKENRLTDIKKLFVSNTPTKDRTHFGSRITFDQQGHLYFGIGDRGQRHDAQDLTSHSGKVIRLNLDGSVPSDNPFVKTPKARPEIYSYGHRNPQGIFFDPTTKFLWLSEHGPRGGDEINLILPGKNYGWPIATYGREYWGPKIGDGPTKPGVESPKQYFVPSIAPSSLIVVQKDYYPNWKGGMLQGALVKQHLNLSKLDSSFKVLSEERYFNESSLRIRSVVEAPSGKIIVSTDSGGIYEVKVEKK